MSTTTLPNRLPNQLPSRVPAPPRDVFRQWGRTLVTVLAAVGAGLWAAAVRVGVWTGRLTTWFVAEPGRVLFISGEDDEDDTLVPRLIECGADLDRVAFLSNAVHDQFHLSALDLLAQSS